MTAISHHVLRPTGEKASGPVILDTDETTPAMCYYHVACEGPCGWNADKWKTILVVHLSKRAHSILPFVFIAPDKVYLLFDCALSQWRRSKKKKTTTIFPLELLGRHGDRGKTHLSFVWYNLFLERVYSQALRALFVFVLFVLQANSAHSSLQKGL